MKIIRFLRWSLAPDHSRGRHGPLSRIAADLRLEDEERARLDKVSAPPLNYPYWHQAATARDRLSPADLALLGPYLG